MKLNLENLTTEQRNEKTKHIDTSSVIEILETINEEDALVHAAVRAEITNIAKAVEAIVDSFKREGRLFYVGAGTSGRLGILDASECPPTFSTEPELVQAIIAGGYPAIFKAVEGAEDSMEQGKDIMLQKEIGEKDVVVGITASGRTPYVLGAIRQAKLMGAVIVGLSNNADSELAREVDIAITPLVGPEVITGSTRMKAGTSQKLVLNMLSTGAMIRCGKVYGNLMVDVKASNEKLIDRCERIVMSATGVSREEAKVYLGEASNNPKKAIIRIITGASLEAVEKALIEADEMTAKAISLLTEYLEGK
jgi:N-acetylmuramic acid 6-phosphate etherase